MKKNSKIYVAGDTGMVGSAIVRKLNSEGYQNMIFTPYPIYDLRNRDEVERFFERREPEYVFMAAAKEGGLQANSTQPVDFIYDNMMIAMNVIHVFDLEGNKLSEFARALPFKPGEPKLIRQISSKDGAIRMQATFDFITKAARIGLDGNLYLLTFTESHMDRAIRNNKGMALPPHPMRIDMIDTKIYKVMRRIDCDGDTRAFDLMDENHIVYVYVDSEGEVILKCIQF